MASRNISAIVLQRDERCYEVNTGKLLHVRYLNFPIRFSYLHYPDVFCTLDVGRYVKKDRCSCYVIVRFLESLKTILHEFISAKKFLC